jgi:hypothetical protein
MKVEISTVLRARRFRDFVARFSYHERRYLMIHGRPKAINAKVDVAGLIRIENRMWLGEITHI